MAIRITINGVERDLDETKSFQGFEAYDPGPPQYGVTHGDHCTDCTREVLGDPRTRFVAKPAIALARLTTTSIFLCKEHIDLRGITEPVPGKATVSK